MVNTGLKAPTAPMKDIKPLGSKIQDLKYTTERLESKVGRLRSLILGPMVQEAAIGRESFCINDSISDSLYNARSIEETIDELISSLEDGS